MQALVNGVLILVQGMFASIAIVGKLVFPVLPPAGLVVFRVVGAAAVLTIVTTLTGRSRIESLKDWLLLILLGVLGVSANQSLFLAGLERTTAINASLLVTTVPVFTVLFSVLGRQEKASPAKVAGIGLAGAGVIYLIGPDRVSMAPDLALGNGLVVAAMMCYSGFLVLSKPLLKRYGTLTVVTWAMTFGILGTLPLGIPVLRGVGWGAVPASTWAWVVYIVLIPTLGAFSLNAWALRRSSSHLVAAFIYLQPLITASIAPAVLAGERITPRTLVAALAIFTGLGLVIIAEARRSIRSPIEIPGAG
jgi:drug/metabolite transporter (DMT)-like permease